MVEYKCPKVIEKTPEVMGLNVLLIVVLIVCALCSLFAVFYNYFLSLSFIIVGGGYFYLSVKFSKKGELQQYIKYNTGIHCIKIDQELKTLIKTK